MKKKKSTIEPEGYLSEKGLGIFGRLVAAIEARGYEEELYGFELSMLANELDRYENAILEGNEKGFYNVFDNGTTQVNAFHTLAKSSLDAAMKLGVKFGMTPKDLKDIGGLPEKKEEKVSKIGKLRKMA